MIYSNFWPVVEACRYGAKARLGYALRRINLVNMYLFLKYTVYLVKDALACIIFRHFNFVFESESTPYCLSLSMSGT